MARASLPRGGAVDGQNLLHTEKSNQKRASLFICFLSSTYTIWDMGKGREVGTRVLVHLNLPSQVSDSASQADEDWLERIQQLESYGGELDSRRGCKNDRKAFLLKPQNVKTSLGKRVFVWQSVLNIFGKRVSFVWQTF